jgi:hypothetical protein
MPDGAFEQVIPNDITVKAWIAKQLASGDSDLEDSATQS